jgi:hypothetical protein
MIGKSHTRKGIASTDMQQCLLDSRSECHARIRIWEIYMVVPSLSSRFTVELDIIVEQHITKHGLELCCCKESTRAQRTDGCQRDQKNTITIYSPSVLSVSEGNIISTRLDHLILCYAILFPQIIKSKAIKFSWILVESLPM